MFHRIQQYELLEMGGRWNRPRAYGDPEPDGTWDGWLVFFPLGGGSAIAPSGREATQATFESLDVWAAGLTPVHLQGALARALSVASQAPLTVQLADAEYEALEDAARLETAAEVERSAADLDEAAAGALRADAERIRRGRLATEAALAATEEAAARMEADLHEESARDARALAADAARRRRSAEAEATPGTSYRRRGTRKKKPTRKDDEGTARDPAGDHEWRKRSTVCISAGNHCEAGAILCVETHISPVLGFDSWAWRSNVASSSGRSKTPSSRPFSMCSWQPRR